MPLELEVALDILRTDGFEPPVWGEPKVGTPEPKVGTPGMFVNQCGRCLEWRQARRVDLSRSQRVWLCEPCRGPNPPEVVIEKAKTWQQIQTERKKAARAAEREARKRERDERKARNDSLPRMRRGRRAPGEQADAQPEGSQGAAVRVRRKPKPLHGGDPVPDAHGSGREAEEVPEPVLD